MFFCSILEFPLIINDKIFTIGDPEAVWAPASLDFSRKPFPGSYLQRCVLDSYKGWVEKIRKEYVPDMPLEDTLRYYKYWFVHSSGDRMIDFGAPPAKSSPTLSLPETFYPIYDIFIQQNKPYKVNSKTAFKYLIQPPTKAIKAISCQNPT